jgi:glycosyltransferase involved in cell wall biosynthesis
MNSEFEKSIPVSLVLLSYNQENYIEAAINSALAQDYPNLKIVISDDCSSDHTFERAKNLIDSYAGSHSIELRRNDKNLGLVNHVNTVISQVDTELVVVAAGDDISLPHRVSKLVDVYQKSGKPKLISSTALRIDEEGNLLDGLAPDRVIPIEDLDSVVNSLNEVDQRFGLYLGATGAWSMDLWRKYGPIQYTFCYEDVVMGFRAALEKSYVLVNEPLVKYRVNGGVSSQSARSIRGKLALRKKKVNLLRDLARQRCDDLALSSVRNNTKIVENVRKQAIIHSIRCSLYESPVSVWKYFKKYPSLTILGGVSEGMFVVRYGVRVGFKLAISRGIEK